MKQDVPLSDLSDEDLVQRFQERGAKDDRPFRELLQRHQQLVWRTCYSFMKNPQDAEDLTQEVFFKVYRYLEQFEGRASFKTWLYRIAVNTCKNEIRKQSHRPQLTEKDTDTLADVLPDEQTMEMTLMQRRQNELLAQAMAQLRPEEAEIIRMKDLEQRQYHEIAEILDIGLSAAKMRVQRARLAFQIAYNALAQGAGNVTA